MRKNFLHLVVALTIITVSACSTQISAAPFQTSIVSADAARQALLDYFSALNENNYDKAATIYGGDYEVLSTMNPEIDPNDHALLFQTGCTFNGFLCNLKVLKLVKEKKISDTYFQFFVEFETDVGELFVLGPCCGEDPGNNPSQTQFEYHVRYVDGHYVVDELPIYIP